MERLLYYFPNLTPVQVQQFEQLDSLYRYWNERINVISRKDIDNLYLHHVLHSLGIAKVINFRPGTLVMDVGTGGGFPGIPLAILFPEVKFLLIDSIGKKVRVAQEIGNAIGLQNVEYKHGNVMEEKRKFEFIVSRAVMNTSDLVRLVRKNINAKVMHNALPPGLICLKGGDLTGELQNFKNTSEVWHLSQYFTEDFFETKQVVYVALKG